jgi:hypothetical protein
MRQRPCPALRRSHRRQDPLRCRPERRRGQRSAARSYRCQRSCKRDRHGLARRAHERGPGGWPRPSTQASASARASRRSVFTFRVRVACMGAKFGSATTTSCPNDSRPARPIHCPARPSITIRARGRPPSTAAKRSGSVRIRRSISSPPRPGDRSGVPVCGRRCPYDPWLASPHGGGDRGFTRVGQRLPPRRAGGQPLHPIYDQSLDKFRVPAPEKNELLAALGGMKPQIVGK